MPEPLHQNVLTHMILMKIHASVAKTYTLGELDSRILWMTYYCIQIYTHVKEVKIKMEQDIKVSLHQAVKITNGVNAKHDFPGQPF